MNKKDKKEFLRVIILPFTFIFLMWLVKLIEIQFDLSFIKFGVFPKQISGLKGIIFSPFIHKDFTHLFNNSYPIIILGSLLFTSYKDIASKIFLWLFFISGFWLWVIGRESFHIGASGVIYALASFLFVSGFIRKNPRLAAVSMVVIFLYGSMIWGVLPVKEGVSWEGHLAGFLAGILIAIFYKNEGPQQKKYQWEIDEELEMMNKEINSLEINYVLKEKK